MGGPVARAENGQSGKSAGKWPRQAAILVPTAPHAPRALPSPRQGARRSRVRPVRGRLSRSPAPLPRVSLPRPSLALPAPLPPPPSPGSGRGFPVPAPPAPAGPPSPPVSGSAGRRLPDATGGRRGGAGGAREGGTGPRAKPTGGEWSRAGRSCGWRDSWLPGAAGGGSVTHGGGEEDRRGFRVAAFPGGLPC